MTAKRGSRGRSARGITASLAPLLLVLPLCGFGDCYADRRAALAEHRTQLEATTQPKAQFWTEVQRKGEAFEQLKRIQAEHAAQGARFAQLEQRSAQVDAALARASDVNARAADALAGGNAQRDELDARVRALEAKLERWTGAPPPEPKPAGADGAAS